MAEIEIKGDKIVTKSKSKSETKSLPTVNPQAADYSDKSAPEIDSVPSETSNKKSGRTGLKLLGCLFVLGFVAITFFVGGIALYIKAEPILEERGIMQLLRDGEAKVSEVITPEGERETVKITSEESVITSVVQETMDSVVTIAVSQLDFNADNGGVIASTNNIGTGFIVDPQGYILTNQHVVSDGSVTYEAILNDGRSFEIESIARDDVNDIAIVKIDADDLKAVELGDSDSLIPGQMVIAIGTPLGEFAGSVTTGVISGLNRTVSTGSGSFFGAAKQFEDVIQTDAAVNPGNSGGPLLNSAGEVIGINFATTSGADNISFALPINRAKSRIEEFRAKGRFIIPYVGIQYQMISEADAKSYRNVVPGAFVARVVADSPAATAGLQRGDIIAEINGEKLTKSFAALIQGYEVGDKLKMRVFRDGNYRDVEVTLVELKQ